MSTGVELPQTGKPTSRPAAPPPVAAVLAWAGIAGPILFTITFVVLALFRSGYSHVADPVSALGAGPDGWMQSVNFLVFGALMIAFAIGLHLGIRPTRAGVMGPALLALGGVGLVLAGLFPWVREASGEFTVPTGHLAGAVITFLSTGAGLTVTSRRLARDPRWRGLAAYTLLSGIALLVLFPVTAVFAAPDLAPLHEFAGLLQRAMVAVWFFCAIVLSLRLRRLARTGG